MNEAVKFSGRMLSYSTLTVTSSEVSQIRLALDERQRVAAINMPVVLDATLKLHLGKLLAIVRDVGLNPIGVHEGHLAEQAPQYKLAVLSKSSSISSGAKAQSVAPIEASARPVDKTTETTQTQAALGVVVHSGVMRSGQSVTNPDGDLVILNDINAGSEAIAGANLHVYGRGLGRLIAGIDGNPDASIYCMHLDPALVSIAGVFCLPEDIPADVLKQPARIHLEKDGALVFTQIHTGLQLKVNQ